MKTSTFQRIINPLWRIQPDMSRKSIKKSRCTRGLFIKKKSINASSLTYSPYQAQSVGWRFWHVSSSVKSKTHASFSHRFPSNGSVSWSWQCPWSQLNNCQRRGGTWISRTLSLLKSNGHTNLPYSQYVLLYYYMRTNFRAEYLILKSLKSIN